MTMMYQSDFLNKEPWATSLTRETSKEACKVWFKLAQQFLLKIKIFKFLNLLLLFCCYLSLEKIWPFISTNMNSHQIKMLCANFG